ncbi:NAD(P)/FAD-dependent oxidoreductase [Microbacterium sp.]|uniref:flavin-containing monooxygenase n=1 Tax=Microbacterium sp. TaxID=51671 RepID=UPI002E37AA3B|nr:NAD(P)/FAD-dependent oxidoreductase [Microbacterium sp.]HEX5729159.1 NAD(P)/FAD-dependent oxidoreductase [Microbacterium sp.]
MDTRSFPTSAESADIVIIGGGQAGLALGYHLVRARRDFVILDAGSRVGDAWRTRWDSLRLFTPAKFDGLDGMPFPGDRLAFPTKDEQADYLEAYAARFALPVRTGIRVERVRQDGDGFLVEAGSRRWRSNSVVLATGAEQVPFVPVFADRIAGSILQVHSSDYRNPAQLRPGAVLVVGLGNSGAEIALELSSDREVLLAGEPVGELPFRHGRSAARFALPLIRFAGTRVLTLATPVGRRAAARFSGPPLIRTRLRDLAAAGVTRVQRITDVADGLPRTADGRILDVASVVWCTGYREDFGILDLPGASAQRPDHERGEVSAVPGLYLLGQEFLFAAASATLPGVRRDARYLASRLAAPAGRRSDEPMLVGVGRRGRA